MQEQENIRRVKDAYAAWGRRDMAAFLDTVAEDIEWVASGPADLPWSGAYRGKPAVSDWFRAVGQAMDIRVFEVQQYIAQGDTVVVRVHEEVTMRNTGRMCVDDEVQVWTYRDGKLVHWQEYYDTAAFATAYRGE